MYISPLRHLVLFKIIRTAHTTFQRQNSNSSSCLRYTSTLIFQDRSSSRFEVITHKLCFSSHQEQSQSTQSGLLINRDVCLEHNSCTND